MVWPILYADIEVISASTIDELWAVPVNTDNKRDKSPMALVSPDQPPPQIWPLPTGRFFHDRRPPSRALSAVYRGKRP